MGAVKWAKSSFILHQQLFFLFFLCFSFLSFWCLTVWNNFHNKLHLKDLSRPPWSDLIRRKLAITSRDPGYQLLRSSQASTRVGTAKFSWRTCPAFLDRRKVSLRIRRPVVRLTLPAQGGESVFCVPSPKLLGCVLSLPQAKLFSPESRENNLQLIFAPKEWMRLRSCLERCYLEVDKLFVNQRILFSSCCS